WIPLTLPAAMASPATAGPARRTKAASALNHFEKLFMLSLPSSNLMARSPLTLKGRAFIRSTWDRTCFNSGDGRHQLGADRPARTSVDGVVARSTTLPACPHPGPPPPIWVTRPLPPCVKGLLRACESIAASEHMQGD